MNRLVGALAAAAALGTAALLASCAGNAGSTVPSTANAARVVPAAVPPDCTGQKTTKQYASVTEQLDASGGSACIPAFGGFGGDVNYPTVNPSISITLTTSTTDYDHQPKLGKGKPIFYIALSTSGGTSFGSKLKPGGGLTGAKIIAGQDYSVFGQAVILGFKVPFSPCHVTATKGTYGGVIGNLLSLVKGQSIPAAGSGVLEIYSGKLARKKC